MWSIVAFFAVPLTLSVAMELLAHVILSRADPKVAKLNRAHLAVVALFCTVVYLTIRLAAGPNLFPGVWPVLTLALTHAFAWSVATKDIVGVKRGSLTGILAGAALLGTTLGWLVLLVGFHVTL